MTHVYPYPDIAPSASICADCVRWVSQLRNGELIAVDQQRLDAHLIICERYQIPRPQPNSLFKTLDAVLER